MKISTRCVECHFFLDFVCQEIGTNLNFKTVSATRSLSSKQSIADNSQSHFMKHALWGRWGTEHVCIEKLVMCTLSVMKPFNWWAPVNCLLLRSRLFRQYLTCFYWLALESGKRGANFRRKQLLVIDHDRRSLKGGCISTNPKSCSRGKQIHLRHMYWRWSPIVHLSE